jgi:uncharacterized protein (DUF4415 family)
MAADPTHRRKTTVTERKRSKPEERSYAALLLELGEMEKWNRDRKLKERMIPGAWRTIEAEVPVRPKKVRVTAAYDEELVKWFRAMGHNYQARMNAVLRAYMLAMKSREIVSQKDRDWKGDAI